MTRPAAASATPMSEPPCSSLKLTQWPQTLRYLRASSEASGATEVEPLIVIVGLAIAAAGASSEAENAAAASADRRRLRFIEISRSSSRFGKVRSGAVSSRQTGAE